MYTCFHLSWKRIRLLIVRSSCCGFCPTHQTSELFPSEPGLFYYCLKLICESRPVCCGCSCSLIEIATQGVGDCSTRVPLTVGRLRRPLTEFTTAIASIRPDRGNPMGSCPCICHSIGDCDIQVPLTVGTPGSLSEIHQVMASIGRGRSPLKAPRGRTPASNILSATVAFMYLSLFA